MNDKRQANGLNDVQFALQERIEVLEALERQLRARLLNAREPQHMQRHAAKLRNDAQVLLDLATQIESGQCNDVANVSEITVALIDCVNEREILCYARKRGLKPKQIKRLVQMSRNLEE